MREKLIELVLDYCVHYEEDWDIPYKADELRKYTNEYLLELIEKQLDYYMNSVHGTGWREKEVGVNLVNNDLLYGYGDLDPLFPNKNDNTFLGWEFDEGYPR